MKALVLFSFFLLLNPLFSADRPNILWISAEDHGPQLGCYGDAYATTPNLDAFAEKSLLYTRASSNAPVCAPARTTIISGMYPPSTGSQHMRSRIPAPSFMKFFPAYLQEAGYYTTNNAKEDYNLTGAEKGWDESSTTAHWKNRPAGKPFFAVFNTTVSHESRIRNKNPNSFHDPATVPLPPYHPDLPAVRKEWAQYYDRIQEVDAFFAGKLAELGEAGLAEDTIVFFWADHGSGMPRSKRYPGWTGLHVPLIVHFPDKWRHLAPEEYEPAGKSDRLVAFIDFAPTLLSIAGIQIPDYYQGNAFAGDQQTADPACSFGFRGRMDERPDFCRSATDGRYIYIRNYYPHLPHGQFVYYQQQTKTSARWRELFLAGDLSAVQSQFWKPHPFEELVDLENDYHAVSNLADDPRYAAIKERLARALDEHMQQIGDLGFLPEPLLHAWTPAGASPRETFNGMLASDPSLPVTLPQRHSSDEAFACGLESPYPVIRYWTLMQFLDPTESKRYGRFEREILEAMNDPAPIVAVAAAECVGTLGDTEQDRQQAVDLLLQHARYAENGFFLGVHALNALDHVREAGVELPASASDLMREHADVPAPFNKIRMRLIDRF